VKFEGLCNNILYVEFEEKLFLQSKVKVFYAINIVLKPHILSNLVTYCPLFELSLSPLLPTLEIKEYSYAYFLP